MIQTNKRTNKQKNCHYDIAKEFYSSLPSIIKERDNSQYSHIIIDNFLDKWMGFLC